MQEVTKQVAHYLMEVFWPHPEACGTMFAMRPPGSPQVLYLQLMVSSTGWNRAMATMMEQSCWWHCKLVAR